MTEKTWEAVIGLEVHTQLMTQSKIFSGSSIQYGAEPNVQACNVDLGMPGVLPAFNAKALELAAMFGLAIGAKVSNYSVFARKNYFYPDLPKGYQISQLDHPIVVGGSLIIQREDGSEKEIRITRAHLEEDAGKSLHEDFSGYTGIDLNRAGTPLLEIVSEPDLSSAAEVVAYLKKLHHLVTYLQICDGNMQEGSFRCDANISVRRRGEPLGIRAEIKNVNSFRFVEQAINYEINRQIELLESGGTMVQETRLYDPDTGTTRAMRSKEEANDYRYFPDPDLLPIEFEEAWLAQVAKQMPELPEARYQRFVSQYALPEYDAGILTGQRATADYFEAMVVQLNEPKLCANWVMGELSAALNRENLVLEQSPIPAAALAELVTRIHDGTISGKIAKEVFEAMWKGEGNADQIIEQRGLKQVSDSGAIEAMIDEILAANPKQVEQYRAGQEKVLGFFVGQVMKASQGKANPALINQLLLPKLKV